MSEIVFSKFAQNPQLQTKLLETGDRPLLETTYDSFWGCGLPLLARKLKQGEWHGRNQLGSILVDCHTEIRRERAAGGLTQGVLDQCSKLQSQQQSSQRSNKQPSRPKAMNARQTSKGNINKSSTYAAVSSHNSSSQKQQQFQQQFQPTISTAHPPQSINQPIYPNNQQMPMWSGQMMYPPPSFQFSNLLPPMFMYPPYSMPSSQLNNQAPVQLQMNGNRQWSPQSNNKNPGFAGYVSPVSSVSDHFVHGERRLSYDPCLSPKVHV